MKNKRIAILGNSGSGKSTLALEISRDFGIDHLDLDTLVWEPGDIAVPRSPALVAADLDAWLDSRSGWVIEGCYAQWVGHALPRQPQLIFLDPGIEVCVKHCLQRTWEPHKYESKSAQDSMLEPLIQWVREYEQREDETSRKAHEALFNSYSGPKERRP